nr:uncharacterized protein LOC108062462 [Drosophila takahashii]
MVAFNNVVLQTSSKWEFTNCKCNSTDISFGDFAYCYLKSVNRTYKYLSAKYLLKKIATDVKVNLILYKRFNGYKPFLYNVTADACKFLKSPNSYPVQKYFYTFITSCSNLNHSCPYDHDIIFDKITADIVNQQVTKILPFPKGDYLLEINYFAYNIHRAVQKFYGTLS